MRLLKNRHTYVTIKSSVCNLLEVEMKKDIHTLNSPLKYLTLRGRYGKERFPSCRPAAPPFWLSHQKFAARWQTFCAQKLNLLLLYDTKNIYLDCLKMWNLFFREGISFNQLLSRIYQSVLDIRIFWVYRNTDLEHTYLARRSTMITKVVPLG